MTNCDVPYIEFDDFFNFQKFKNYALNKKKN